MNQEKVYKTMEHAGIAGIVGGIVLITVSLAVGIMSIVYGSKLVIRRRDVII